MTEFSATMDQLMQAQNELEACEKAQRRARLTKVLANIGIIFVVGITSAWLVGVGLLSLMPIPDMQ